MQPRATAARLPETAFLLLHLCNAGQQRDQRAGLRARLRKVAQIVAAQEQSALAWQDPGQIFRCARRA